MITTLQGTILARYVGTQSGAAKISGRRRRLLPQLESSKMAVMSEEGQGIEQKFQDDAGEPVSILEDAEAEPEVPKPKKKKIVKRMVRTPKKTEEGSHGQSHYAFSGKATKQGETLSTLASTSATVVADITTQGQESDPFTALKEIGNVLTWNEFLEAIETNTNPDFLFRAHRHAGTSQPIFVPDLNVPFDLQFRRTFSIDEFAAFLAEHLNKTQEVKETCFVSMSPMLEWTLHTAGQKQIGISQVVDQVAGLAIFDVEKLRQTSDTTIFRVSDVLDFLASRGKGQLIARNLQKWARNCDEYVSMGRIPNDGLVRWVAWEELSTSPAPLFADCFVKTYTLAKYREWIVIKQAELEDICHRIVEFGKVLAGLRDDHLLLPLTELILRPGIRFWGFETNSLEEIVKAKIHALVDEAALLKLSRLSIS